ncbi:Glutarate-semialdehyde dehydrogenase / Succinate-semialdehyde dehydrogenase [NAD] [hydrothermal vent metagenome]|uniref:Glutarate-semialdehyde dehydrogenase / Succinate-semialdehyde dehydrogenase [NAD] n=1 Tax=hydrothermal vent metagenome TaxID=652676 RepID=A0A3B1B0V0_9ZZZZ
MIMQAYIAGQWIKTEKTLEVANPYDGSVFATVPLCSPKEIEQAIAAAAACRAEMAALEPYQRADALSFIRDGLEQRAEEFASALSQENGKTIIESRLEVARAAATFDIAAGEATRIYGEAYDLGINKMGAGRRCIVRHYPIGVVSAIAPFNFPLNLAIHKIAPAFAVGCPVVLKPASKTPVTSLMLAEIIELSGLPKGAFSVVPSDRHAGQQLVEDGRINLLSFTGSPEVGWKMKRDAGKKKVVLELGGNAGLIIDQDIKEQDWDWLISRTMLGAFYQSGQVCISVQRIFAHHKIYDEFKQRFIQATKTLTPGDPLQESTTLGPIVDTNNRDRLKGWIDEAIADGAHLLSGNAIAKCGQGNTLEATILENVKPGQKISCEEAFGPVVTLSDVGSMEEAFSLVNDSDFGLQCGIFTNDFDTVIKAFDTLEVGGVIHNDVPSFRVDSMPYGGVKDSGLGREGIRYAMQDMLEERVLVYKM